ncbi:MAG: sodium:solute symporter [Bacteroidia bacterium]
MSIPDWIILVLTIGFILLYGIWKSRGVKNIETFLLADRQLPWYHVGLSVMATQASAITFISAPGLAYSDGLRFVQFYFGLPLAVIVLCTSFIPIFRRLNVFTAYEYLEKRFDQKTRTFTALLFLLQRGLSTGISIYLPSIILSTILKVDSLYTTFFTGGIVIFYTVYGGARAVSYTQLLQMIIIFSGLFLAAWMVVHMLPANVGFSDALHIAGKMGKMNAIDTHFDLNNKYNIWSGIIGGFFLQLSYFGTDQSQVGRYLTGRSVKESRLGLIMNGFIKIPMQFFILLIGILVFTFYQFSPPPLFFNANEVKKIEESPYRGDWKKLESSFAAANSTKLNSVQELVTALHAGNQAGEDSARVHVEHADQASRQVRKEALALLRKNSSRSDVDDSNYVFLSFVTRHFPVGLVGLLIAIIFLASMGSIASAMNSLASSTVIDFYRRIIRKDAGPAVYLRASRWSTVAWGVFCMIVALYAHKLGNLIEAVNQLGSIFYGTILGIFLVAFFMKKINGTAVFCAAIVTECGVFYAVYAKLCAYLWLNVFACLAVMLIALILQQTIRDTRHKTLAWLFCLMS